MLKITKRTIKSFFSNTSLHFVLVKYTFTFSK